MTILDKFTQSFFIINTDEQREVVREWMKDGNVPEEVFPITDPSLTIFLAKFKKLHEWNIQLQEFKEYDLEKMPTGYKRHLLEYIEWDGYFFGSIFVKDILESEFFKYDLRYEIALGVFDKDSQVLCFKVDNEYCVGVTNRYPPYVKLDEKGVLFQEIELTEESFNVVEDTFVPWEDGKAVREYKDTTKVVYKKDRIFKLHQASGDFLDF